jgi:4-amino-4-deoxy-L-arabinose transferase-like glycosyltransferase
MTKDSKSWICLVILWAGVLANNFIWLGIDRTFFTYDSYRHFLASLKVYEILKHGSFSAVPLSIDTIQLHPPLVMIFTVPFYFLFGAAQNVSILANSVIFSGILLFSVYGIGFKLAGRKSGLLAAFITGMYPVIFNQLKVYMLDLPLTAMVTLSMYFLFSCDDFKQTRNSILFFISAGLGMLIKSTFIIFLAAPAGYAAVRGYLNLRREKGDLRRYVKHLVLFGLLSFLVCAPYYFTNFYKVLSKLYPGCVETWPTSVPPSSLFLNSLRGFLWYFWGFINWQVSFFFFLVFIAGGYFFSRAGIKNKIFFWLWIVIPWVLTGYFRTAVGFNMEVTGVRYTMPFLPAIALISAIGIMRIPLKRLKAFLVTLIVVFGILQLLFVSYPLPVKGMERLFLSFKIPEKAAKNRFLPDRIILLNFGSWAVSGSASGSYPADYSEYSLADNQILETIDSFARGGEKASVFIIPDNVMMWHLRYMAYLKGKPFWIFCDWNYMRASMMAQRISVFDMISNADYVIDQEDKSTNEPYMRHYIESAENNFSVLKDRFALLRTMDWPDGGKLLIYKKLNRPQEE